MTSNVTVTPGSLHKIILLAKYLLPIPHSWPNHKQNGGTRWTKENMRGENDDINNSPYGVDFCPMHHAVSWLTKIAQIAQSSRSLQSCPSLAGELQLWGTLVSRELVRATYKPDLAKREEAWVQEARLRSHAKTKAFTKNSSTEINRHSDTCVALVWKDHVCIPLIRSQWISEVKALLDHHATHGMLINTVSKTGSLY